MFSGDLSDVAPPDPIPNSEVKRVSADNTYSARDREDRSSPGNSGAVFSVRTKLELFLSYCGFRFIIAPC